MFPLLHFSALCDIFQKKKIRSFSQKSVFLIPLGEKVVSEYKTNFTVGNSRDMLIDWDACEGGMVFSTVE